MVEAITGWKKLTALALGAIVSLFLIVWSDFGLAKIADLNVRNASIASLDRPSLDALSDAEFKPGTGPFWPGGPFGAIRFDFNIPDPRSSDLALFVLRARDNFSVYINGTLAAPTPGLFGKASTLHGTLPRLIKLLPSLLRPGKNTIVVLVARNAPRAVIYDMYLGPAARLERANARAHMVSHDAGLLAAIVAGIVLLFAIAVSSIIRRPNLITAIALVLALILLNEIHALWINYPWPELPRNLAVVLIGIPLWTSLGIFANEWTSGPSAYRRWFALAAAVSCVAAVLAFVTLSPQVAIDAGSLVETIIGTVAIAFMVQRLVRYYYAARESVWPEVFVAAAGLTIATALLLTQAGFLRDVVPDITGIEGGRLTKMGTIAIILFIAIGLARHGIEIYQLATLNNETLARRVDEKEREIAANHALLRDRDRERALHAERARIMRDVHDGIGSQLLGLLVQARAREPKGAAITGGLQEAIEDLYLVVDSLDGIDGSLETALGTFRSRIEPKCTAAGIAIDWHVESIGETKSIGPAAVLQVYRILQEAVSNAIRHGRPKHLSFYLHQGATPGTIEIAVTDDGPGFDAAAAGGHGRGISNMRRRAETIGAGLKIDSGAEGTRVALTLPR